MMLERDMFRIGDAAADTQNTPRTNFPRKPRAIYRRGDPFDRHLFKPDDPVGRDLDIERTKRLRLQKEAQDRGLKVTLSDDTLKQLKELQSSRIEIEVPDPRDTSFVEEKRVQKSIKKLVSFDDPGLPPIERFQAVMVGMASKMTNSKGAAALFLMQTHKVMSSFMEARAQPPIPDSVLLGTLKDIGYEVAYDKGYEGLGLVPFYSNTTYSPWQPVALQLAILMLFAKKNIEVEADVISSQAEYRWWEIANLDFGPEDALLDAESLSIKTVDQYAADHPSTIDPDFVRQRLAFNPNPVPEAPEAGPEAPEAPVAPAVRPRVVDVADEALLDEEL